MSFRSLKQNDVVGEKRVRKILEVQIFFEKLEV